MPAETRANFVHGSRMSTALTSLHIFAGLWSRRALPRMCLHASQGGVGYLLLSLTP